MKYNEKKIDLMIVGGQKCGTTSLNNYLIQHPKLIGNAMDIEFNYFVNPGAYKNLDDAFSKHFGRNISQESLVIAKNIMSHNSMAIRNLYDHNPLVKIVFIMRDPLERSYSSFEYARRQGWEDSEDFTSSFQTRSDYNVTSILDVDFTKYKMLSDYEFQYHNLTTCFPEENIIPIIYEDFVSQPQPLLDQIILRLELEPHVFDVKKIHNEGAQPRFQIISKFAAQGKRMWIKKLIPFRVRKFIRKRLLRLNEKKLVRNPLVSSEFHVISQEFEKVKSFVEDKFQVTTGWR